MWGCYLEASLATVEAEPPLWIAVAAQKADEMSLVGVEAGLL
jgi:hypothetical protein